MSRPAILVGVIVAFLLGTVGSTATADSNRGDNAKKFRAELKGFEEIPTLSTPGTGRFEARLSHDGQSVDYELQYQDLESNVRQAHIHLGAPAFNGGIMVFLCSNLVDPAPPPGTQPCPATGGTIQGTFTAANVIGPAAQGVSPGEFEEVIRAMRAGAAYANVHTETRPGGEIRGQILRDDSNAFMTAIIDGPQEPTASPALGTGYISVDTVANTMLFQRYATIPAP